MYKYKYLLLFFSAIAVLLLWFFFPVSFDNNDDQTMYVICSGIVSGVPSPNIILSNILTGKILTIAFSFTRKINWYTLYLQIALLLSFLCICRFFIRLKNNTFLSSLLILLIVFLGFFSLSIVKLQFTTVALFCCFTSLLSLQTDDKPSVKLFISLFFLTLAIFIRKEAFFIFIIFIFPFLFSGTKNDGSILVYIKVLLLAGLIFGLSIIVNNNHADYKKYMTYSNVHTLDIIAAKPVKINKALLEDNNLTAEDITLIQSWLLADDTYLSGKNAEQLALKLKSTRNMKEVKNELKKFMTDERYLLIMLMLTVMMVLLFVRAYFKQTALNLFVFCVLMLFLVITSRIPHRITSPILTYLILFNIGLFAEKAKSTSVKRFVLTFLLLISTYKFYCTAKLINIHKKDHALYAACQKEINAHPESLFIAPDGFPIMYMNAWQTPENDFPAHNLILGGWYACSPDYHVVLKQNNLRNITSDLKNNENVFFLTGSKALEVSYVRVMKLRYQIDCHFEEQIQGFNVLKPRRLVFDN